MHKRYLGFLGVLFSLVVVLSACTVSGQTTPVTQSAEGTPIAGNDVNAFGTPIARGATSPFASPSANANLEPTNLATAFSNLQDQNSYVMTAKLLNLQGSFAAFTGNLPEATLRVTRNGSNRHLEVMNGDNTVFEAWVVNDQAYVDLGNGPTQLSSDNALVKQISGMVSADQILVNSLESKDANYKVVGTEQVNGLDTKVETAQYQFGSKADNRLFFGNMNGTVTSKIWVTQNSNFLMKADFMLNGQVSANSNQSADATPIVNGTPISGMSDGTPTANAGGEVMITISNIGNAPQIQAPSS